MKRDTDADFRVILKQWQVTLDSDEPIGFGHSATVYRVRRQDGEVFALRRFGGEADEQIADLTGFRLAQDKLGESPHLVKVHQVSEPQSDGVPIIQYALLEYCDGETLAHHMIARPIGMADRGDVFHYLRALAKAAQYLRASRLCHWDWNPMNIFITQGRGIKLGDYGALSRRGESISARCAPEWMDPEALAKRVFDDTSDLYVLGLLYIKLRTGKDPSEVRRWLDDARQCEFPGLELPESAFLRKSFGNLATRTQATPEEWVEDLWRTGAPGRSSVNQALLPYQTAEMLKTWPTLKIGIVGSKEAGKTTIFGMLSHPAHRIGALRVDFPNEGTEARLKRVLVSICRQGTPNSTEASAGIDSLTFLLVSGERAWCIETFDYAGELTHLLDPDREDRSEATLRRLADCDAILLVVDCSRPNDEHRQALDRVRRRLSGRADGRIPPMGLVLTKVDLIPQGRENCIPDCAAAERELALDSGGASILDTIKRFPEYKVFAVSAYGHPVERGKPVQLKDLNPHSLLEPLCWAAERASSQFRAEYQRALDQLRIAVKEFCSKPIGFGLPAPSRADQAMADFRTRFPADDPRHTNSSREEQAAALSSLARQLDHRRRRLRTQRAVATCVIAVATCAAGWLLTVEYARHQLKSLTDDTRSPSATQERVVARKAFLSSVWATRYLVGQDAIDEQRRLLRQDEVQAEQEERDSLLSAPVGNGQQLAHNIAEFIEHHANRRQDDSLLAKRDEAHNAMFASACDRARDAEVAQEHNWPDVIRKYRLCIAIPGAHDLRTVKAGIDRAERAWDLAQYTEAYTVAHDATNTRQSIGQLRRITRDYLAAERSHKAMRDEVLSLDNWLGKAESGELRAHVVLDMIDIPYFADVFSVWAPEQGETHITLNGAGESTFRVRVSGSQPGEHSLDDVSVGALPIRLTIKMWCPYYDSREHWQTGEAVVQQVGLDHDTLVKLGAQNGDPSVTLRVRLTCPDLDMSRHGLPPYRILKDHAND